MASWMYNALKERKKHRENPEEDLLEKIAPRKKNKMKKIKKAIWKIRRGR